MSSTDQHRRAHEAFNERDWARTVEDLAADAEYTDVPRGVTVKGPAEFIDYLQGGWTTAFSDAAVTNARYIDGGDTSVALFLATGTNDGSLGPMPATGRALSAQFCEVMTFDAAGKIVRGELFYDQVTLLVQLGRMPPPAG
ncbi:ester cyclase [Pseudonocardia sp. TRM90224]|uniref:ester cyclase n=1 Tax=Pseudonocardia sp. TRM90224 TaxID=2812678 RepID=UPI001E5E3D5C|nr:nuclear transport factor 2 family protein [Pseudonocardia sp. TRM90224]